MTRDPIGYVGGIDLYAYAGNNPPVRIDPTGWFIGGVSPAIIQQIDTEIAPEVTAGEDVELAGGGPEDPVADIVALTIVGVGAGLAGGNAIGDDLFPPTLGFPPVPGGLGGPGFINAKPSKTSQKERATNAPSWSFRYPRREPGQTCEDWATEVMNEQYGAGNWSKGPNTEFSKIKKECERNQKPKC